MKERVKHLVDELHRISKNNLMVSLSYTGLVERIALAYELMEMSVNMLSSTSYPYFYIRVKAFALNEIKLAIFHLLSGFYIEYYRTLRHILETFIQAYFLETTVEEEPQRKMKAILKELSRMRRRGRSFDLKMISSLSALSKPERRRVLRLYRRLTEYQHPSIAQMVNERIHTLASFSFSLEQYSKGVDLLLEVLDVGLSLLCSLDDTIRKALCSYEELLKALDMKFTLRKLS